MANSIPKWEPDTAVDADQQSRVVQLGRDADGLMKLVALLPRLSPKNRPLLEGIALLMLAEQQERARLLSAVMAVQVGLATSASS